MGASFMAENEPSRPPLYAVPDPPRAGAKVAVKAPAKRSKSRSKSAVRSRAYRARLREQAVTQSVTVPSVTPSAPVAVPSVTPVQQQAPHPDRGNTFTPEALSAALFAPASEPLQMVQEPPQEVRSPGRAIGLVLVATALAIAALAIGINAQTGARYGTSPLAAWTFAGLSIAADMLAIVLPSAAVALWWNRRRTLSVSAWATWVLAATMATLASVGFASLHLGDTAAGRAAVVTTATEMTNQRSAAIEAARAAAQAATISRQAECQKRGPKCRDLEHVEQARMSELQSAISVPVPTAATIADADPQVTGALRLASWAGLKLSAGDIGNLRLALMGLLPNLAGLVLAFGVALRGSATPRRDTVQPGGTRLPDYSCALPGTLFSKRIAPAIDLL
jgi:hypothetical protein